MPNLTPTTAYEIARAVTGSTVLTKDDGDHLKYAFRVFFPGDLPREIAIVREPTVEGVTVYVNKRSCQGEPLEVLDVRRRFPGARGLDEYPKGHKGKTGDKGISAAAGSCPSLLPLNNDVLRISCADAGAFRQLVRWCSGSEPLSSALTSPFRRAELPDTASQAWTSLLEVPVDVGPIGPPPFDLQEPQAGEVDDAGRLADPVKRAAIERRAVDLATTHYEALGYEVTEKGKPYDLLCTPTSRSHPGMPVVHVEVKGSVSSAATVHLTRNEVLHAREEGKNWRSDLFIVGEITLRQEPSGAWLGGGGKVEHLEDWRPDCNDLTPTDFVYKVPRAHIP